jgi:hypothetical protein
VYNPEPGGNWDWDVWEDIHAQLIDSLASVSNTVNE